MSTMTLFLYLNGHIISMIPFVVRVAINHIGTISAIAYSDRSGLSGVIFDAPGLSIIAEGACNA